MAADRSAIDDVVGRQLRAFRDDDGGAAFALATARLRRQLGSPARLMDLVRREYAELYRPRSVSNVDFVAFRGYPTRRLRVVGADGAVVVAYYMMRQDDRGEWRIAGCVLARRPAETSQSLFVRPA